MSRFDRTIGAHLRRARGMERFVRFVVAGGIALVAGLWLTSLFSPGSAPWLVGAGLVLLGAGGLVVGIGSQIDY